MTPHEMVVLAAALAIGGATGVVFFGGLWWTTQKGVSSRLPALWFAGSLLVRTVVTVAGFYVASGGSWERLLLCLSGFLIARALVVRLTGIRRTPGGLGREAGNAPHS